MRILINDGWSFVKLPSDSTPEEINDDCSMDELVAHIDAHKEVNDEYELSIHAEGNTRAHGDQNRRKLMLIAGQCIH